MLKKILAGSMLLGSTMSIAFANPAPYLGGSMGVLVNTSSNVATSSTMSEAGSFRGVPFSLFAGYGGVINQNFYIAGELFGTVATAELNNANGLKTTYGYGASVLPGVMLSDHTLAFARAGIVRTRFSNAGTSSTGGQFGLGLQTTVTQNIDVRGEYDFTAYRSLSNSVGNVGAPRQDAFNLALVYKFD